MGLDNVSTYQIDGKFGLLDKSGFFTGGLSDLPIEKVHFSIGPNRMYYFSSQMKKGILDQNGEIIIKPENDEISTYDNYASSQIKNKQLQYNKIFKNNYKLKIVEFENYRYSDLSDYFLALKLGNMIDTFNIQNRTKNELQFIPLKAKRE